MQHHWVSWCIMPPLIQSNFKRTFNYVHCAEGVLWITEIYLILTCLAVN